MTEEVTIISFSSSSGKNQIPIQKKRRHLVIGLGEVGGALKKVLECDGYDPAHATSVPTGLFDVLHICFPWSENFIDSVFKYKDHFNPRYIVIHSTVPIGVSRKCGAMHSPVRGMHPNMVSGLKTFIKFIGAESQEEMAPIAEDFLKVGVKCHYAGKSENTEALKLWDTMQYGVFIMLEKEINQFCKDNDLDFNVVYTLANETYNAGYEALGRLNVRRPVLKHQDGKVGGHCVTNNAKLLVSRTAERFLEDDAKL